MKEYSYKDKKENRKNKTLTEKHSQLVEQAERDFQTSKAHILNEEYYTWRAALQSYHLSTYGRKVALGNHSWKQNISIGLVRSLVDIMITSTQEKPLVFQGKGINEKGTENKDNIIKTLNYISDISKFHKELKTAMSDGLILGEISLRVGYKKSKSKETYYSLAGDEQIQETVEVEEKDYPYAKSVSIFNMFPDPYSGDLRYITERDVVSYLTFIEIFGHTIRSKHNESPFKDESFLQLLTQNRNQADLQDYGSIVNEIHAKYNAECEQKDKFSKPKNTSTHTTTSLDSRDNDQDTNGLIEYKATWYPGRLIIFANDYPVYIGKNPYGFIPYVIKAGNHTRARFGEGIPYMVKSLEDVGNSFINNYFDSARAIAQPTFVAQKNLMINDNELEQGTPGGILYTENNNNGNAVYRLDKGGLQDFNILNLVKELAFQITGVSEYDLGVSAKERTATGALAVAQSSQKRLSPYMSNFLEAISVIAVMWLKLAKAYWPQEKAIYVLDEEGRETWELLTKGDIIGGMDVSLEAEGIFGANQELKYKKIVELYNTLSPSGFNNSPEMAKEIVKTAGYNPSKFITEPGEGIKPENAENIANANAQTRLPGKNDVDTMGETLRDAATPNIDLGNGGRGNI